jgi:hypothetical protein
MTIVIAALPATELEALALRGVVEVTGHTVELVFVATPDHLYALLAPERPPALLILCAHGADGGLHFGPLADGLGKDLRDGTLPLVCLDGRVRLSGTTVFCTGCSLGTAAAARPFLDGGAAAYIAAADHPEGADMLLAAHHFVHAMVSRGLDAIAACRATTQATADAARLVVHARSAFEAAPHAA